MLNNVSSMMVHSSDYNQTIMPSLGFARAVRSIPLKAGGSLTTRRHAGSQFRTNLGKPGAHLDGEARVSVEEQAGNALVHHGPDFDTHVDHGTSYDH